VPARYSPGGFVGVFADARGGLVTVRKVGSRFVTVRGSIEQSGASSICLWRAREGIRRCQRGGGYTIPSKWLVRRNGRRFESS
jgi:hypothetical protein